MKLLAWAFWIEKSGTIWNDYALDITLEDARRSVVACLKTIVDTQMFVKPWILTK